jgi:hypothetical protein
MENSTIMNLNNSKEFDKNIQKISPFQILQDSEERVLGVSPRIDKVDINLNQNLNKLNNQNITQS